jgi:hypothetical protein
VTPPGRLSYRRTVSGSSAKRCLLRGSSLEHCRREVHRPGAIPRSPQEGYILRMSTEGAASSSVAFVGRSAELGELRAALPEALGGSSRAVLITGEPGVGKTALAIRLAREAEALAVPVRWGRGSESGERLPSGPGSRSCGISSSGRIPPTGRDWSAMRHPSGELSTRLSSPTMCRTSISPHAPLGVPARSDILRAIRPQVRAGLTLPRNWCALVCDSYRTPKARLVNRAGPGGRSADLPDSYRWGWQASNLRPVGYEPPALTD